MNKYIKILNEKNLITHSLGLDIYMFNSSESPKLMMEIGRIREREFQSEGFGTGKDLDIDCYDLNQPRYNQLIAWDPINCEIVAMYRFIHGALVSQENYSKQVASAALFSFSQQFLQEYLPFTIDLGRAVVNKRARLKYKGLFAIWIGLGTLTHKYSGLRYFFGKLTVSSLLHPELRAAMYALLGQWCQGDSGLVSPYSRYQVDWDLSQWKKGSSFFKDITRLTHMALEYNSYIPPLLISYTRLTPKIQVFGTAINASNNNAEETGILISICDIREKFKRKFINSYITSNSKCFT